MLAAASPFSCIVLPFLPGASRCQEKYPCTSCSSSCAPLLNTQTAWATLPSTHFNPQNEVLGQSAQMVELRHSFMFWVPPWIILLRRYLSDILVWYLSDRQHLLSYLCWEGCVRGVILVAARLLSPHKCLLLSTPSGHCWCGLASVDMEWKSDAHTADLILSMFGMLFRMAPQ